MDKHWIVQGKFYTFCHVIRVLDVAAQTQEKKLVKMMGSIDKLSFMQPTWIDDELFGNKNLSRVDIQRCLYGNINSIASSYHLAPYQRYIHQQSRSQI